VILRKIKISKVAAVFTQHDNSCSMIAFAGLFLLVFKLSVNLRCTDLEAFSVS